MKKNRWYLRLLALLVLCGALNVTITAAAEAGSSDDPLVTLSYLNETFIGLHHGAGGPEDRRPECPVGHFGRQRSQCRVQFHCGDPHQRTSPHWGHRL